MVKEKIRIWMLIYSIIFALLSVGFVQSNMRMNYHVLFVAWSIILYFLVTVGNFCYTWHYSNDLISKSWKIVFILFVLHFIIAGIIDGLFSADLREAGIVFNTVTWLLSVILFFPSFRANYLLAYRKDNGTGIAGTGNPRTNG